MDYDKEKVDNAVLALLYLKISEGIRGTHAWKSYPWDAMDRLHNHGYISDPRLNVNSVAFTEEGRSRAEQLFHEMFVKKKL